MYLEGIFIGGDIRAQLPEEAEKFDTIDTRFRNVSILGKSRIIENCQSILLTYEKKIILKL